jgi:hypothetical protein
LSTLEGLGFLKNRKKIHKGTVTYNGVSRLYGGLDSVNSVSLTGKGEQNKRQLQTNVGIKESLGKRHGSVDRQINSNESSRSSWPIALQKSSNFEDKGLTLGGGHLEPSDSTNTRSADRTSVVDYQTRFLEWESLIAPKPSLNNSTRCQSSGLGG